MIKLNREKCLIKLNRDIDIIINTIRSISNLDLISIILYGSYGRDEGAFYDSNGKIFSYNDYDLLLITKSKSNIESLEMMKSLIKKKVDIKFIDLSQKNRNMLKYLRPTIFNYDLKYGSRVIWGDKGILDLIPEFKPEQITLKDAEILYFTRLYTFLGSLELNAFQEGVKGENSRFFRNQMAKAILAIVDTELIQLGAYHTSYRQRVNNLANLYSDSPLLVEMAHWALNEKLNPQDIIMNSHQLTRLYKEVIQLFFDEMFKALSIFYGTQIVSTDDIRKAKAYSQHELLIITKHFIKLRSLKTYKKQFRINMAQSYVAESYLLTDPKKEYLIEKCKTMIKQYLPDEDIRDADWNQLRVLIAQLRLKGG